MWDAGSLPPWMQRWVARTRVLETLLYTYPQVREYGSFHFCARRMAVRLSVDSASTPRRPSTDATKVVNFQSSFKQVLRYLFFFSHSEVSRNFSGVLYW